MRVDDAMDEAFIYANRETLVFDIPFEEMKLSRKGITWLTFGELIKADDPSPFPALTQIEVYDREHHLD